MRCACLGYLVTSTCNVQTKHAPLTTNEAAENSNFNYLPKGPQQKMKLCKAKPKSNENMRALKLGKASSDWVSAGKAAS
jgi:hypothetical protein